MSLTAHQRFPLLEGVRALAAVSVLLLHAGIFGTAFEGAFYQPLVAHLDLGVPLFFLVSGFVLYRPMLAARVLAVPGARVRDYARRRVARILPLYWVVLTAAALYPGVHGVFTGNWWVYYGLLQNYPVFTQTADCVREPLLCAVNPAWTLALELVFYAVLPLWALGMARATRALRGQVGWVPVELAPLGLVALASLPIQGLTFGFNAWLFYSPLGRGWWFGLGMALAVASVRAQERGAAPTPLRWAAAHPGTLWGLAGALYVAAALFFLPAGPGLGFPLGDRGQYVIAYVGAGVVSVLIAAPALLGDGTGGWPRRLLALPLLDRLGRISYGIYLWHYPVLIALYEAGLPGWGLGGFTYPVMAALGLLVTCALSELSYRALERPIMRWAARPRHLPELPLPQAPAVALPEVLIPALTPAPALALQQVLTLDSAADGDGAPDAAGGMAGGV